jgi:hypothetical protein
MARILVRKRLFNPSRKKKLTLKQKLYFGTKRQRNAARKRLANLSKSRRKRRENIGEIYTIKLTNPGRSKTKTMARHKRLHNRKRRRNAPRPWSSIYRRHYYKTSSRRRHNPRRRRRHNARHHRRHYRMLNPIVIHRVGRRHNRAYRRRRNPLSSDIKRTIGIIAGAVTAKYLTGVISSMSASLASGYMNLAVIAAVAVGQGWVVKKVFKQQQLGDDLIVGGLVYLSLQLLNQFFPSLSLSGLGYIGNSSFYVPQVPVNGSMGKFQLPPAVSQALAAQAAVAQQASKGMGAITPLGNRAVLRRSVRVA